MLTQSKDEEDIPKPKSNWGQISTFWVLNSGQIWLVIKCN